mmetsp:Transcript_3809/g.11875  ORF Transcript_3809/g.11875 Transcript_3809/m.11875 type:complete len:268 (-) Transcript_3809:672-1475(-)
MLSLPNVSMRSLSAVAFETTSPEQPVSSSHSPQSRPSSSARTSTCPPGVRRPRTTRGAPSTYSVSPAHARTSGIAKSLLLTAEAPARVATYVSVPPDAGWCATRAGKRQPPSEGARQSLNSYTSCAPHICMRSCSGRCAAPNSSLATTLPPRSCAETTARTPSGMRGPSSSLLALARSTGSTLTRRRGRTCGSSHAPVRIHIDSSASSRSSSSMRLASPFSTVHAAPGVASGSAPKSAPMLVTPASPPSVSPPASSPPPAASAATCA